MRWIVFLVVFWSISFAHAQGNCPPQVMRALSSAAQACDGLGRNQACYANLSIDAQTRTPSVTFASVGDTANVADLQALRLSALDLMNDVWGIAIMNLQASLPDSVAGQGVRLVLLGDVQLENRVSSVRLSVTATANARLRREPVSAGDANVIVVAPSGTVLEAHGRNEAGDWLRVVYNDVNKGRSIGWVSTQVLSGAGERMKLEVIEANAPLYAPLQAFVLRSGIGDSPCSEAPESGLLVQTPSGVGSVSFNANGVEIALGSTAFLQTQTEGGNALRMSVVEGTGFMTAEGSTQVVPSGTFVTVPLSDDFSAPIGEPSAPQGYDDSLTLSLPLGATSAPTQALLPEAVTASEPLSEAEIETQITAALSSTSLRSGLWQVVVTNITTLQDTLITQEGVAGCTLNTQVGRTNTFRDAYTKTDGAIVSRDYRYIEISAGRYRYSKTIKGTQSEYSFDIDIIVHSPTSYTRVSLDRSTWYSDITKRTYFTECRYTSQATWLGE
jgi:hypothetical protein